MKNEKIPSELILLILLLKPVLPPLLDVKEMIMKRKKNKWTLLIPMILVRTLNLFLFVVLVALHFEMKGLSFI